MKRHHAIAASLEQALWHHHAKLLIIGMAIPLVRMWWFFFIGETPTHYPVSEFLINYADGFVRRGLGGQISITLHTLIGGSATFWATFLLTLAGIAFCTLTLRIIAKANGSSSYTPLVLAPWGLLFMAYDPDVLIRKEVFGFLPLCLILLGALSVKRSTARLTLITACLCFPPIVLIHEAIALLGGALLCAVALLVRGHPSLKPTAALLSLLTATASALAVIAAARNQTADPAIICAAIPDPICTWPFPFIAQGMGGGLAFVQSYFTPVQLCGTALVLAACALPFFGLRQVNGGFKTLWLSALAISLPILPLFAIGIDFGRWFVMIATPAALLALTAIAQGMLTYTRILPPWAVVLYCGTWSFNHIGAAPQLHALALWAALALLIATTTRRHEDAPN